MTVTHKKKAVTSSATTADDTKEPPKYHCDSCSNDVTNTVRVRCADPSCPDFDLCVRCFTSGKEPMKHKRWHDYRVMKPHEFPIFSEDWDADEELLLIEAAEKMGMGNWQAIADYVGTKTKEECEDHYLEVYVDSDSWPLPDMDLTFDITEEDFRERKRQRLHAMAQPKAIARSKPMVSGPTFHEIQGYMPYRYEFETEVEQGAEEYVKDMIFNDEDTQDEIDLKLMVLEIYNSKLDKRKQRKELIFDRGLLEYKKNLATDKRRPKEERDLLNRIRVFARLQTKEDFDEFFEGLLAEQSLRDRISQLQEWRRNGITMLKGGEQYEKDKAQRNLNMKSLLAREGLAGNERFITKYTQRQPLALKEDSPPRSTTPKPQGRKPANPLNIQEAEGVHLLTPSEQAICSALRIMPRPYLVIKDTILKEYARLGSLKRRQTLKVAELRQELSARQLPTKGLKKDLIERLKAALKEDEEGGNASAGETTAEQDTKGEEGTTNGAEDEQAEDNPFMAGRDDGDVQAGYKPSPLKEGQPAPVQKVDALAQQISVPPKRTSSSESETHAMIQQTPVSLPQNTPSAPVKRKRSNTAVDEGENGPEVETPVPARAAKKKAKAEDVTTGIDVATSASQGATDTDAMNMEPKDETQETDAKLIVPDVIQSSTENSMKHDSKPADDEKKIDTQATSTPPDTRVEGSETAICVKNFVRPLVLGQVKELVGQFGETHTVWLDSIKTHCFVSYNSPEHAVHAVKGLHGIKFPKDTGRILDAFTLPEDIARKMIEEETLAQSERRRIDWEARLLQLAGSDVHLEVCETTAEPPTRRTIGGLEKLNHLLKAANASSPSKMQQPVRNPTMDVIPQQSNVKVVPLDTLFRSTTTLPKLYYKPIDDSIAQERLTSMRRV
ncbi:hypothetical protein BZG36_03518 [Bifiguratus adelaidae]|uniref:Transcriptional adapter 2 n=1 Tax=Bifiguratus adelaidae TaxID=1938954 RepID=A0A261XY08_9FUNG|nr:hypothetical protein BZG36_03518 [Bifiguratus adelaidae]